VKQVVERDASKDSGFPVFRGARAGPTVGAMTEFLGELYVSREHGMAVEDDEVRVRAAAAELTREGRPVRFLRTIFVPEDETCFYLFEASSAGTVREVGARAALLFDRVSASWRRPGGREESK
jgi:hypothetical protein